jgi:hypothetical protein
MFKKVIKKASGGRVRESEDDQAINISEDQIMKEEEVTKGDEEEEQYTRKVNVT